MKILFPFVGDSVGGSHISTLELYSSLIDANIPAIIVLHRDDGPLSQYLSYRNISFSVLKSSRLAGESPNKLSIIIGIFANFFHFGRFIRANEIDIVHGNDLRVNLSWSLPAKIFSKGFIWHQRTLLSASRFWLLIRYLCDYFVVISDVVMQSAPQNIQDNQKIVVYNPFNIEPTVNKELARSYVVEKYNIPSECFLLGCIGRVVDYKNIDFVIKNISDIYNNNVYLMIVGTGPKEYVDKLKKITSSVGMSNRIVFTGFVDNTNKIISSLDLLVAPSLVDAFGRSIVEAMLQNTPVLAAKYGGHVEIVNNGINGMLYNPDNKNDFISKVSIVMNDKSVSILKDNAYKFAYDNFSSKNHLDRILSIYNRMLLS
jgi:glycosyltransferase involved in cell wall biosynthesis